LLRLHRRFRRRRFESIEYHAPPTPLNAIAHRGRPLWGGAVAQVHYVPPRKQTPWRSVWPRCFRRWHGSACDRL